jgi:hypothetical protein
MYFKCHVDLFEGLPNEAKRNEEPSTTLGGTSSPKVISGRKTIPAKTIPSEESISEIYIFRYQTGSRDSSISLGMTHGVGGHKRSNVSLAKRCSFIPLTQTKCHSEWSGAQ